jgi:phosphate transport system permease protein
VNQPAFEIRLTRTRGRPLEQVLRWLFFCCAAISVLTTLAVVGVLSVETFHFFQQVPALDFLFGTRWTPLLEPKAYGILPLVFGTTLIVIGAAIVALPVGLACAIYLSEYAGNRTRDLVKPVFQPSFTVFLPLPL